MVKDNQFHGYGELFNELGVKKFEGTFINHKLEGKGTRYSEQGSIVYTGDFKDDEMTGHAIYYYEDGSRHEGLFENGQPEGFGT